MENTANKEIRKAAKEAGVCLWEIADKLGINDGNFSRKLRRELPAAEREKVLGIIRMIAQENRVAIDTTTIPNYVRPYLLAPIADAVAEFMQQPGIEEKFQEWLASKKAAEAAKQGGELVE